MRKILCAALAVLLLAACDASNMVDSAGGEQDVALTEELFEAITAGDIEPVRPMLGAEIQSDIEKLSGEIASKIPKPAGGDGEVFSYRRLTSGEVEIVTVTLRYSYPDEAILLFTAKLQKGGGETLVDTVQFNYLTAEDLAAHDFTFEGKGLFHYAFLALLAATALFILWSLVVCLRTPISLVRKLIWCVVILLGVGGVTFVWTSGAVSATLLAVSIFCVSFAQSPLGPWILEWSFPLGAALFHVRLWRAKKKVAVAAASGSVITLEAAFALGGDSDGGSGSDGGGGGDGGGGD